MSKIDKELLERINILIDLGFDLPKEGLHNDTDAIIWINEKEWEFKNIAPKKKR